METTILSPPAKSRRSKKNSCSRLILRWKKRSTVSLPAAAPGSSALFPPQTANRQEPSAAAPQTLSTKLRQWPASLARVGSMMFTLVVVSVMSGGNPWDE